MNHSYNPLLTYTTLCPHLPKARPVSRIVTIWRTGAGTSAVCSRGFLFRASTISPIVGTYPRHPKQKLFPGIILLALMERVG